MDELSSTGERVYVRLRMAADSAGRFYGDAEWVLSKCFSCRVHLSVDEVEQALCELEAAGMVVRYEVEGGRYLAITEWGVRQRSEPKFPAPPVRVARPGDAVSDDCPSAVSQLSDKRQSVVRHMSDSCQTSPLSPSFLLSPCFSHARFLFLPSYLQKEKISISTHVSAKIRSITNGIICL